MLRRLCCLMVLSACCAVLLSCGAADPNPTKQGSPQTSGPRPTTPGAWDGISEQSTCEVIAPNFCLGQFGFFVDFSGQYIAGGNGGSEQVRGRLTDVEFTALNAAANDFAASAVGSGIACDHAQLIPGVSDTIAIDVQTTPGVNSYAEEFVYRTDVSSVCHNGDATRAAPLRDLFHQLRAKYYPIPFP